MNISRKIISVVLTFAMLLALCTAVYADAEASGKIIFADFTNAGAETLPMSNPNGNSGAKITKETEIFFGASGQSGRWRVTGSNGTPMKYTLTEAGIDVSEIAGCNMFVIRFYSTTAEDAFNALFYAGSTYRQIKVTVTKSGWQELAIPMSDITAKFELSELTAFTVQKGGWGTVHNKENIIYFDSMWFERRSCNVAASADDSSLMMEKQNSSSGTLELSGDCVYGNSQKSIHWSFNSTNPRSIYTKSFDSINIDSEKYNSVTFRMFSKEADSMVLLLYYKNDEGVEKYTSKIYNFTEEADNIGKWITVTLDISNIGYKLTKIGINYNGWGTSHTATNDLYIDKIWLGTSENINAVFNCTGSAYDGAKDVNVFDSVSIEFDAYLSGTVACDAVSVTRDGNAVTGFKAWTDKNKLFVKTNEAMRFESVYEITVTPALTDQRGYALAEENNVITFTTAAPYLAFDSVKITDGNGNDVSAVPGEGAEVAAAAGIVNGSETGRKFTAVIAMYDEAGSLLSVKVGEPAEFPANMEFSKNVSAACTVAPGTAKVRGFLISDVFTLTPFGLPAEI